MGARRLSKKRSAKLDHRSVGTLNDGAYFGFATTRDDTFLGVCSLSHIHPVYHFCNLGYWIRSSRRGQGLAGRAARLAARFAFERLNLIRVEIVIAAENTASQKAAEKIGAHREGIAESEDRARGSPGRGYVLASSLRLW